MSEEFSNSKGQEVVSSDDTNGKEIEEMLDRAQGRVTRKSLDF